MIVADKKPIEEIIEEIKDMRNILVLGCNECVTVCEAGGKKEVGVLASALRMYFMKEDKEINIRRNVQGKETTSHHGRGGEIRYQRQRPRRR